ncbi:nuclear transport factor 2 family protein [Alteromonas halophila]|uniref:Transcriptional regulator n=1 Tax=Alteromonas halophila TaxID=516698 RepID=A0A918MXV7_9ALTE|nr:nuclear transport factor 2 family protein [Alteromonas halophila]GGW85696.1 transcriptional regulator [Alteromonas halophila]
MYAITRFKELYQELSSLNPDDLGLLYADDVVFIDPITTHRGLTAVTQYFSALTEHAESCQFDIDNVIACEKNAQQITHVVTWTMTLIINKRRPTITLDGITQLRICNDRITYHRDYYDLGEMVYEHIPILGWFVKKVKKRLAT